MCLLVRLFALLIIALAVGGCDAVIAHFILPTEGIRPAQYAVEIERDVAMTTSDTVAPVADIIGPRCTVRTPRFSCAFRSADLQE